MVSIGKTSSGGRAAHHTVIIDICEPVCAIKSAVARLAMPAAAEPFVTLSHSANCWTTTHLTTRGTSQDLRFQNCHILMPSELQCVVQDECHC